MSPPPTSPKVALERRRNRELATPNADGSQLEGFVEHPASGSQVPRLTVMSGWHAWDKQPILTVLVESEGRIVGRARAADRPRDDVAAALGDPRYANAGWVVDLDFRAVSAPTVTLVPTVFPAGRATGVRLEPVTVSLVDEPTIDEYGEPLPIPDEVLGRLDEPRRGTLVPRGPLTVTGWARSTSGSPIIRVALSANGVELGLARLGLDRADVAESDPAPDAPICGFEQLLDLGSLDLGSLDLGSLDLGSLDLGEAAARALILRATATARDGLSTELETEVVLAAPAATADGGARVTRSTAPASAPPSNSPLELLVVTHDLGYGGAQLWLFELLRRGGAGSVFPCTVVAFRGGALAASLRDQGVEVHVTSPLPVDDAVAYEGRLAELTAWLSTRSHTAALVNTFRSFPGADLAVRLGLPLVWAVHESWPESLIWAFDHPGVRIDPAVRAAAASALANAGAVVFESEATRELYEARAPGRTALVQYGIDTAALDAFASSVSKAAARQQLGLPLEGTIVLVMGTIEPRKAQTLLTEAFASVAAHHGDTTLVLVGDLHTPYSAALAEYVERSGLSARVRVEGVTPDALTWYRSSDLLLCGSDVESLPRSVLDAMCLGLPVVATGVFGLAELLEDGETGLVFAPCDLDAASEALDRALSMDAEALAALGARGRDLVHASHDASGYTSDVLALLRGLLADPTADPAVILAAHGRASGGPQSASS